MTFIDPMDATELSAALRAAITVPGSVYLRGQRGSVPAMFEPPSDFTIGSTKLLRDGGDLGFIATGLGTIWALEAADLLAGGGAQAAVLHVPTIKPFDTQAVAAFAARFASVLTVENHSIVGGLGSAVCEAVAEAGVPARVKRLGVPDSWAQAGPLDYLRTRLNLDGPSLARIAHDHVGGR